jgi:hypothetical protein
LQSVGEKTVGAPPSQIRAASGGFLPFAKLFACGSSGSGNRFSRRAYIPPSLLLGERQEFRLGERIAERVAKIFSFLFVGPLRKYRPIAASVVAAAMIAAAKRNLAGVNIFESDQIQALRAGE